VLSRGGAAGSNNCNLSSCRSCRLAAAPVTFAFPQKNITGRAAAWLGASTTARLLAVGKESGAGFAAKHLDRSEGYRCSTAEQILRTLSRIGSASTASTCLLLWIDAAWFTSRRGQSLVRHLHVGAAAWARLAVPAATPPARSGVCEVINHGLSRGLRAGQMLAGPSDARKWQQQRRQCSRACMCRVRIESMLLQAPQCWQWTFRRPILNTRKYASLDVCSFWNVLVLPTNVHSMVHCAVCLSQTHWNGTFSSQIVAS
jgi:hypothetical protein